MRISEGSILQFEVAFTIPVNNSFNKINITDQLAEGLKYTLGDAQIYLDDSDTPLTSGVADTSTETTVTLSLDNTISQGDTMKEIRIKIPVLVDDINALFASIDAGVPDPNDPTSTLPAKNIATIAALDVDDNSLSEVTAEAPLTFNRCEIFGFGGAFTTGKVPGADAFIIANIPGIDSLENPNLTYRFKFQKHPELDFESIDNSNVNITISGNSVPINSIGGIVENNSNNIVVIFPHLIGMKGSIIYITFKVITQPTITAYPDNFILIDSDADLYYNDAGENNIVCEAPSFDVRINLIPSAPTISGAIKVIV